MAYTSGANGRGQLKIEARVHRSVLMKARVRTEPCSPRLLVLKIDGKNINLTVIVAHAPPNDSGEQGRKYVWSSLRKTAQAVPRARPLALLIDANGRVGIPRADSLGAVLVTWKTQMGASYEGYSKRGTCMRCQLSPLSTSQLGGAGGLNTEADASTMWLSAAIGWMMLQNRRHCLRFNFLVNRSTMCLSERSCCGHISAPETINPYRECTTRWPWILG